METEQPSSLQMPSFLHGSYTTVQQRTRAEGRRCSKQFHQEGSFPAPRESLHVPSGELVVAHEVADFQRTLSTWRLYMLGKVTDGLCEALDWKNSRQVSDAYEAFCRETAWGALYFAVSQEAPLSARRMAVRLEAVLRFWDPLQSVRYRFKTVNDVLTLEELLTAACDWAMNAWFPAKDAAVRHRLEKATEQMAQATREDSTQAILRQMPQALAHARGLKNRQVLENPEFIQQRLATLEPAAFERVSGAFTAHLIELLYDWDHQLAQD